MLETVDIFKVKYFRVEKIFRKKIFTIIFVVRSLMSFDWNNVGSASETVAQHYLKIGPMYRVVRGGGVVAFRGIKLHPYGSQSKHGTITQFCFNVGPAWYMIDLH